MTPADRDQAALERAQAARDFAAGFATIPRGVLANAETARLLERCVAGGHPTRRVRRALELLTRDLREASREPDEVPRG